MRMTTPVLGTAIAGLVAASVMTARAQDTIFVPNLTYRTGPFSNSGIPIANGISDYFAMLNARDGGIGGAKINYEECETGYRNEKGVECYEALKSKKPVVITPYSTGITLALIPKASVDRIPILSMAYGLSASAVGQEFPWIFNPPATYWDGLSMIVKYIAEKEGGLDKLRARPSATSILTAGMALNSSLSTSSRGTTASRSEVSGTPADIPDQSGRGSVPVVTGRTG